MDDHGEPTLPGDPDDPTSPWLPPGEPAPSAVPTPPASPTSAAWEPPGDPRPRRASRLPIALIVALVVSLLANAALAAAWWRADDLADRREERIASLRARVDALEDRAGRDASGGGLEDLFGDLFGDGGPDAGELDDLFGDLFGDGGSFGDLLEGLSGAEACVASSLAGEMFGDREKIPDGDLTEQYEATARWVEKERGLRFDDLPEPTYLTPEEVGRRAAEEIRSSYPEGDARLDSQLLAALGVIDPGTDLRDLQAELIAGQVAGFYDPETGELVVATDDPSQPLDAVDVAALAHELDHALTDQVLGIPVDDDAPATASDEQLAGIALVEGDATLLMYRFTAATLSLEEQLGMGLDPETGDALDALARTPHYLASELQFPYLEGSAFACTLESDGGWEAVDRAYDDPPRTSAEILFPERYTEGEEPADPVDPSSPGDGWNEERRRSFGAAELLWLFEAPGDDTEAALDDARERAGAWGGGEVVQWTRGDDVAVAIALRERRGADGLCESVREWYGSAFPMAEAVKSGDTVSFDDTRQSARLRCTGDDVVLAVAPEPEIAARIAG